MYHMITKATFIIIIPLERPHHWPTIYSLRDSVHGNAPLHLIILWTLTIHQHNSWRQLWWSSSWWVTCCKGRAHGCQWMGRSGCWETNEKICASGKMKNICVENMKKKKSICVRKYEKYMCFNMWVLFSKFYIYCENMDFRKYGCHEIFRC